MRRNHPEETATVVLLLVDADRRTIHIANAGHLPPLPILGTDATFLEEADPRLGVGGHVHGVTAVQLDQAATVVLVTDGLVERRGEAIDESLRETVLAAQTGDPIEIADALVERFASGPAQDDIALLVLRPDPTTVG